ncbi:unnamed protein product [Phytophthora fragariaefolia]|uniref:Unnamed protein product n=1 Tax=Phytophthora fragariaefolia TaxID=1490495 RepID=A0A9W6TUB4_9STRA|nr:unnamed protein product [Phytophthora fragariaefolia]
MPKSNVKTKKVPRAIEATPKDASPSAGEASKRKEVRLPGPYVEPAPSESVTDTPNPDVITGDEDSTADSTAPRATKPSEGEPASANTTASKPAPVDSQDPKSSASVTPSATAPPERSPPPEHGPDPVDYEESEPDQDREQGEVPDPNSSPQLTEQQRVSHPGSMMTPKTAAAVARVEAQAQSESHRDTATTDMPEQQIITNAGIDEGVSPEQPRPDIRRHLSERTHPEASQAAGSKREREASTPWAREQLLALRYWTLNEYRDHLRLSRRPGPGVSQCDKGPAVPWNGTGLTRQTNEREFEDWLRFWAMPVPSSWLRHIGSIGWHSDKIETSWQSQPIEPRSVLARVSADQLRGPAQKRPRGRRSPLRGDSLAPMSYRYQGSRATSPDTGSSRYARGASVSSRHGSRGHPQYPETVAELGGKADRDAPRRWSGPRGDEPAKSGSESRGGLLSAVESCQRLLDAQRADMVTLRGRVMTVESLAEAGRDVPEVLRRLRHRVQGLPEQVDHLDRELDRVSCRLSQCEGIVGEVRHSLSEHLGWIRTPYSRVDTLEDRDARHQSDLVARSAPAPAPAKEELLEVMANALHQYSMGVYAWPWFVHVHRVSRDERQVAEVLELPTASPPRAWEPEVGDEEDPQDPNTSPKDWQGSVVCNRVAFVQATVTTQGADAAAVWRTYQEDGTSADQIDTGTWQSERHDYILYSGSRMVPRKWYKYQSDRHGYRAIRSTSYPDPDPDRYGAIISSTLSNSASSVGTIVSAHRIPQKWYIQELKSQRSGQSTGFPWTSQQLPISGRERISAPRRPKDREDAQGPPPPTPGLLGQGPRSTKKPKKTAPRGGGKRHGMARNKHTQGHPPVDDSVQDSTATYRQPTEEFPGGCPPNPKCRPHGPDQINSTSPRRSPEECNPRPPTGTQGEKTLSAPTDDRSTPSVVGSLGHLCARLDRVSNFADPAPPQWCVCPGSNQRFHRESNQEDVAIKLEPRIDAPAESGSPQTQLREEGSSEGQTTTVKTEVTSSNPTPSGSTKKKSRSSRKKLKAPGSDAGDRGDAVTIAEDQLEAAFYRNEMAAFMKEDPVIKIVRTKLIGSALLSPVTTPPTMNNKLDAAKTMLHLLKEAGYAPRAFDAHELSDLELKTIVRSLQNLFDKLAPLVGTASSSETEKLMITQAAERMTGSSPHASAHASVTSEMGSETSESVIQERMPLGPAGEAMLQARSAAFKEGRSSNKTTVASTRDQDHPSRMQTFFDAAVDRFLKEQHTTETRSATTARKAPEMQDVDMESVGSRHDPLDEFDPDDLSINISRRAAVASAETSTNAGVAAPRIRVSAISELKEFSGNDNDEGRARGWLGKVKSAFIRDQAPDSEKCLVFGDLLTGPARNWKRSDESPLEYLHRLNVAGMLAKLPIKDGSAAARREHFIETLDDRALADLLALLRLSDAEVLVDTLCARQRAKSRQGRAAMGSSKFRQKTPATPNPTPSKNARAVRAIRTMEDSSESEQESSGSEAEDHVRQVYLAAANESKVSSSAYQSRQDTERSGSELCIFAYIEKRPGQKVDTPTDAIDNTCELKPTSAVACLSRIDEFSRSETMMELDLLPVESRGCWKYHAPGKWFKQAKAVGKISNEKATLLFDSGAEVSIIDTAFARKVGCHIDESQKQGCIGIGESMYTTVGRTRIKVTLAGSLVYYFDAWVGAQSGQTAILGMDFMVPAGIRLDLADGSLCLPDEVKIQLSGRRQLSSANSQLITLDQHLEVPEAEAIEVPIRSGPPRTQVVGDSGPVVGADGYQGSWPNTTPDAVPRLQGFVSVGKCE